MSDNTSGVNPVTREEQYLAYIAGETDTKPDKPITRMEKLLNRIAESGGAGGGGAQANWEQNDPFAPDYVKGRTHYKYMGKIVEEMTINAASQETMFTATAKGIIGETYIVHWGDETYTCTALAPPAESGSGGIVLGNLSFLDMGEDTGEPFIIAILDASQGQCVGFDKAKEITFSVDGPVVQKLPKEYYDYGTFYVDISVEIVDGTNTYSTGVTYGEMKKALDDGMTIIARVSGLINSNDENQGYAQQYYPMTFVFFYGGGVYIPVQVAFCGVEYAGTKARIQLSLKEDDSGNATSVYNVTYRTLT